MRIFFSKSPWGNGGDGGDDSGGPWGGKGDGDKPDLSQAFKKGKGQFETIFGGKSGKGGGSGGGAGLPEMPSGKVFWVLGVIAVLGWLSTGFYRVGVNQQAAVLTFGKWVDTVKDDGLHYHLPSPIQSHIVEKTTERRRFDVPRPGAQNFMLTKDSNIIKVYVTVHWYINDLGKYLFRVKNPAETIEIAAESVIREVIALTRMQDALTSGKEKIAEDMRKKLQSTIDEYEIGIQIDRINLRPVDAPDDVVDAFRDVESARADKQTKINEAEGYRQSVISIAQGNAERIRQNSQAHRDSLVAEATGRAQQFDAIYKEYQTSKDITQRRLHIEAMEKILEDANKIILPKGGAGTQGVLPYLPLPGLNKQKKKG